MANSFGLQIKLTHNSYYFFYHKSSFSLYIKIMSYAQIILASNYATP